MVAAPGLVLAALGALTGCFYQPPANLPSSVRVLYSRATSDSTGSFVDVYFLVAREGNELRLTGPEGEDRQPAFARDGLRVYFTRQTGGRSEVWSMAFEGSDERRVLGGDGADYRDPAPSPDGARIAFTRVAGGRSEVRVADADGGAVRTVASGRQPAWSPDGRSIAFVADRDGRARVLVAPAEGGEGRIVAPAEVAPQADPAWHPAGDRIAFTRGTGTGAEIAVVTVAGGAVVALTSNSVEDGAPAWSPAGDRIVFSSRLEKGKWGLRIVGAEGGEVSNLAVDEDVDATDPDWL